MPSDEFLQQLGAVLQAQQHLVQRLSDATAGTEAALGQVREQTDQIAALDGLLTELEGSQYLLAPADLADFDAGEIRKLYETRRARARAELTRLDFTDWPTFVRRCESYDLAQGLDPLAPYEALLSESDLARLAEESDSAQLRWTPDDYIFVGVSGLLAAVVDTLLVRVPRAMTYEGKRYAGSPLTAWMKQYDTTGAAGATDPFARFARQLERRCKTPYDVSAVATADGPAHIAGMSGRTHRFQSLGHDPVLGFVFGVTDILRGTVTGFSYDKLAQQHTLIVGPAAGGAPAESLIGAFLRHLGHLLSDVATPMGLPAPLLPLGQLFNVGSFGDRERTIAEISRWMYLKGYDLRHFLTAGLMPGTVEATLRALILMRDYAAANGTDSPTTPAPKLKTMLLAAHGVAATANAGKVALYQGNPVAINLPQWMAFFGYLLPQLKRWLWDGQSIRLEALETSVDQGWAELEASTAELIGVVAREEFVVMELGDTLPEAFGTTS